MSAAATRAHAALSVARSEALSCGPADPIVALIDTAETEAELDQVRLAICGHPQVATLARRFAARRTQFHVRAAVAARNRDAAAAS
jgi:hypothetical protein